MRRHARALLARVAAVTVWGSVLVALACEQGDSPAGDAPLGWEGATEADEVRTWSRELLESATRWKVEDAPLFEFVPDSLGERFPEGGQQYPAEATFLPDGRVVLLYYVSEDLGPDSILLHIVDPRSGEQAHIPAPRGDDGQSLEWVHFDLVTRDGSIILMGDNQPALSRRQGEDIWMADYEGRFIGSPSSTHIEGTLLGMFGDQSLAVMVESGETNTMIFSSAMAVYPVAAGDHQMEGRPEELLVTTAMPRDPADQSGSAAWWVPRPAYASAASGDTIWIIPTEKPEIFAVDRSGNVVLKVEWEAGDRSVPPGAPDAWEGVDRFSAAMDLKLGTDGLIYVERVTVLDGRPALGAEWLVFSPAGALVAHLAVPGGFPSFHVLAFGDGALVATAWNEDIGLRHVAVYNFRKTDR